jgi:hypothetical protein
MSTVFGEAPELELEELDDGSDFPPHAAVAVMLATVADPAVKVRLQIEYRPARTLTRRRYERTTPDDAYNLASRTYELEIGLEALSRLHGPATIARAVARLVYRQLVSEGWPELREGSVP